ncbi:MAG: carbohydrate binding domain-containing protein [Victivallales bacterium]|nr:carbohydrate binding domain-containing protein [Victivallales bacterium]
MKKLLFFFSIAISLFCFSQDENLIKNSDFRELDANGLPKGWLLRTQGASYAFEDGIATISNKDGKAVLMVHQMLKELTPGTKYIFSCKLKAAEETSVQAYVESTTMDAGKMKWHGVETKKFTIGKKWLERRFSFIIPEGATASYMAFVSTTGVALSIKEIVVRTSRVRSALGGYWDLEDQVELINNGAVATKDKPATLIGLPVEPGKVYMLTYVAEGIGETGNDYPFHEMTVRVTPREVQGGYFFNDVRNVPMPKAQKIGIPAKANFTKINITFNANTKGRVKFYDFKFGEYVPDPKDGWRFVLDEPCYRDIIYECRDAGVIKGQILATPPATKAQISFGQVAAKQGFMSTIDLVDGKGNFIIPAKNLPVGKYALTCNVQDAAGTLLKSFNKMVAKVPKAPMEVLCTPNRYFTINGKPFFPVTQWSMNFFKNEAAVYYSAKKGINSTILFGYKDIPSLLETLEMFNRYGIKVILYGKSSPSVAASELQAFRKRLEILFPPEVRNHPAFFGYFMIDEPLWGGKSHIPLAASQEIYKEFDPYHPTWINAAPRNEVEDLIPYGEACDIYGVDIYPIPYPNSHSGLDDKGITSVGKYTSRMCDITFWRKPTWMALQGFAWAGLKRGTPLEKQVYPNTVQMRFMAYDTMLNGCTGYGLWGTHYAVSKEFYDSIHATTSELYQLSGLFLHGTQQPDIDCGNKDVRVVPLTCGGSTYYAVMNLTDGRTICTLQGIQTDGLTVYQSGAKLHPVNGILKLELAPLEVMMFGTAPLPPPVYELPVVNAELEKVDGGRPIDAEIQKDLNRYSNSAFYNGKAFWIWSKEGVNVASSAIWATRTFTVEDVTKPAMLLVGADDMASVYLNGTLLGKTDAWNFMGQYDLKGKLKPGENTILIKAEDLGALPCGLLVDLLIDGKSFLVTDVAWRVKPAKSNDETPSNLDGFAPPHIIGAYGTGIWGTKLVYKP